MAENTRIEDLRRRVQKDPASIAFAQLAEEYRRAGECAEAVDVCRAGLEIHPSYLSARVTLGRALLALGQLDEAQAELSRVLDGASDNLAAIRGVAEIHHQRGDLAQALVHYRAALLLAPNDPDLEGTIADLADRVESVVANSASATPSVEEPAEHVEAIEPVEISQPEPAVPLRAVVLDLPPITVSAPVVPVVPSGPELLGSIAASQDPAPLVSDRLTRAADDRAIRTIAALEHWLEAIHVARADRHP